MRNKINNLILGSSGFVGKYLCEYLRNIGENIVEYDIARSDQEDCRYNKLPLNNIDRVYFLGWKVGGANYLYDPNTQREQLDWNIKILINTMDQLKHIPFVFVSTQLVADCDTIYGVLKKLGELWTELNGGRVVRLWNVYGAYEGHSVRSHVVADFVHQALNTNEIKMMTKGNEMRQFVYIDDVCEALHKSFEYRGIYDASPLVWNTVYDVAKLISENTGCDIIRGEKEGSSVMIKNIQTICDTKISLDQGVSRTVELFRKYQ